MSILTIKNISKSYFGKTVLDKISLSLNLGDRLVLTGENGAGKSTLLKIIAGQETEDKENGNVAIASGIVTAYLPQQLPLQTDLKADCLSNPEYDSIKAELEKLEAEMAKEPDQFSHLAGEYDLYLRRFEAMGGFSFQSQLLAVLSELGFPQEASQRPLYCLSGGERMRAALAHIIVQNPDLLLLDEPTNHLDIDGIEWLENWIKSFAGTVIAISHDRSFMDNIATHTAQLAGGRIFLAAGNYSDFKKTQGMRLYAREREVKKLQREAVKEEGVVQTMLSQRNIGQYHSRQKKLARINKQLDELEREKLPAEKKINFSFSSAAEPRGKARLFLEAKNISLSFASKDLFADFSGKISTKDRILITGPNGCGKTSLLKILTGELLPSKGQLTVNPRIRPAYMGQIFSFADENNDLLSEIKMADPGLTEERSRNLLAGYGFRDNDVHKKLAVLSGGERARIHLCKILLKAPTILFLDEPTNHLDINSREILEAALLDFDGAIVAVSHDRYFIDKIGERIWGFIASSIGEYSSYQSWRGMVKASAAAAENAHGKAQENKTAAPNRGKKILAADKRRKKALDQQKIGQLEKIITDQEQAAKELEASFAHNTEAEIYQQYAQLLEAIEDNSSKYLQLLEEMEEES